jgi:deazaflavin-dependent oxidoreductase (nitroreductase family)
MWFNPIISFLLRSPLHRLVSGNMMLVSYTGRKSGKAYSTPVNYYRVQGGLSTNSLRDRTWWRNLRGGQPVTLRLQGRDVQARGEVFESDESVATALYEALACAPKYARYLNVGLEADGTPRRGDVAEAANSRVVVKFHL